MHSTNGSHCAWHEWHDLDFGGFLRSIPTPNSWTTKSLTCWFHPGMKLPACLASVNMKAVRDGVAVNYASDSVRCGHMDVMSPAASREDYPFTIVSEVLVMELMEKVEARIVALASKQVSD